MKKIALLSCDDLSDHVVDENILVEALMKTENFEVETISWSKPGVDWSLYDCALIRTTWDYTKKIERFLSVLRDIESSGCILLNSSKTVEWNSDKSYLKEVSKSGVKIVPSVFLSDENEASFLEKINLFEESKFVLKPLTGASADDIKVFTKSEALDTWKNVEGKSRWFVQPFMESILSGERSCFFYNGKLSHAVKKVPKEGDFRVQEEHGGDIKPYEPSSKDLSFCEEMVESFTKDLLYCRIDFIESDGELMLMELELIEPSMYFRVSESAAKNLVEALVDKV